MPVGHLGPDDVVTEGRDDTLGDVAETLDSEGVGAAVIAEDNEPVGIVTDRDIALSVTDGDDIAERPVEDVMTNDPVTLREDEEAIEIARTIGEHNVRRIPVVDDSGDLTGIVTHDDVVATVGEQLDEIADTIEVQSPEYSP
ncbi:CBS domain-containing protein [Halorarum salinum]|uniref:CBS domain-containing protein n=1 Tax=Halorarum salinum TaxID=2743089 RepID=A0A7D5LBU8_9EURY|nr:CBS domain-containing protein [Halobaculum salinum]QLG62787.1 CBS domain-containing protein [Halobaculum salinum]